MAGFMTVLDKPIFDAYPDGITNTHPSLLPAFKGAHAVEESLAAGVKITGCTVHFATLEVDHGPILAQEPVEVVDGDTVESLHERIKTVERRLYPEVLRRLAGDPAA
jgi:phosphoribosylglycinamide formyltransferase-1